MSFDYYKNRLDSESKLPNYAEKGLGKLAESIRMLIHRQRLIAEAPENASLDGTIKIDETRTFSKEEIIDIILNVCRNCFKGTVNYRLLKLDEIIYDKNGSIFSLSVREPEVDATGYSEINFMLKGYGKDSGGSDITNVSHSTELEGCTPIGSVDAEFKDGKWILY